MSNDVVTIDESSEVVTGSVQQRLMRKALRRVGRLKYLRGEISRDDWQNIRSVVWNPVRKLGNDKVDLTAEIASEMQMHLVADGLIAEDADFAAIDWIKLLEFIQQLLPIILDFIRALLLIL